jgi:tetratricopeptide (TPR) repeat protein
MNEGFTVWTTLFFLGAYHGINPGMGWLFAVALGMQENRSAAVWRALVPIGVDHACAVAAAVAVGAAMLLRDYPNYQGMALIVTLMLYFFYTTRILPGLRIFKHALRGLSYARVARHRQALLAFRRALELDPNHALAREGLWAVHSAMDSRQLANDPQTLALIDFDLCLDRAGALLLDPLGQLVAARAHDRQPRPEAVEQAGAEGEAGLEPVDVERDRQVGVEQGGAALGVWRPVAEEDALPGQAELGRRLPDDGTRDGRALGRRRQP